MIRFYKNDLPLMKRYLELNGIRAIGICQDLDGKYIVAQVTGKTSFLREESFTVSKRCNGRNTAIKAAKSIAGFSSLPYVGEDWEI